MYRDDARFWFDARPSIEALQRRIEEDPSLRGILDHAPWQSKVFVREVDKLGRVPHPREWRLCPRCVGKGRNVSESNCAVCGGAGYQYQ
jgi:hypothetical protein